MRFPLTGLGDINTYAVFAEVDRNLINPNGRTGFICPPGIASDDTMKIFFTDLVTRQNLVSVLGFVNERFLFPGIEHNIRFCLVTITGKGQHIRKVDFIINCEAIDELRQPLRFFSLEPDDFALINPNTKTAPSLRTGIDCDLFKKIYRKNPILVEEFKSHNPWNISFLRMFDMSNDSSRFCDRLIPDVVPLYEAKMIHQYDHRFGTFPVDNPIKLTKLPESSVQEHQNSSYTVYPLHYIRKTVSRSDVLKNLNITGFA